jgi:hypothetical protein
MVQRLAKLLRREPHHHSHMRLSAGGDCLLPTEPPLPTIQIFLNTTTFGLGAHILRSLNPRDHPSTNELLSTLPRGPGQPQEVGRHILGETYDRSLLGSALPIVEGKMSTAPLPECRHTETRDTSRTTSASVRLLQVTTVGVTLWQSVLHPPRGSTNRKGQQLSGTVAHASRGTDLPQPT